MRQASSSFGGILDEADGPRRMRRPHHPIVRHPLSCFKVQGRGQRVLCMIHDFARPENSHTQRGTGNWHMR